MPRIFIAIRFADEFKQKLVGIQNALKDRGVAGNFCPFGNLHLTLAFIGEKYDLQAVRKAVSEVYFQPFTLRLSALGTFPTKKGVIWCGVEDVEGVSNLASELRKRLTDNGVPYKSYDFYPHISLVQSPSQIVTDVAIPEVSMQVERVSVMMSDRVDGELRYWEV
ncbi:MAG: RNA 2',3'-cyclic phosphodiesterase [Bacteroidales bacterium]|nr:RNA 2',3'-cyclic phosphodiesterase [Bacteroidales bacterium]